MNPVKTLLLLAAFIFLLTASARPAAAQGLSLIHI